jgi:hypothetical protein
MSAISDEKQSGTVALAASTTAQRQTRRSIPSRQRNGIFAVLLAVIAVAVFATVVTLVIALHGTPSHVAVLQ